MQHFELGSHPSSTPELVTVFEISIFDVPLWWFPLVGFVFLTAATFGLFGPDRWKQIFVWRKSQEASKFSRLFAKIFGWFGFLFTLVWMTGVTIFMYVSYQEFVVRYDANEFDIVEGRVHGLSSRTDPMGDIHEECFVQDAHFTFSNDGMTPGFSKLTREGAPIENGAFVRIAYHPDNMAILRLEAEPATIEAAKLRAAAYEEERLATPKPPRQQSADRIWILFIAVVWANAGIWRWEGRKAIKQDEALREGYKRLCLGFGLWGSIPFLAMGLALEIGLVHSMFDLMTGHVSIGGLLVWLYIAFVDTMWIYWTFFKGGAKQVADHPGLINYEIAAKAIPIFAVLAQFGGLLMSRTIG